MSLILNRASYKNKAKSVSRRRRKLSTPSWQGTLVSYYKMKNKRTILTTANRGRKSCAIKAKKPVIVDLVDELYDTCDDTTIFVLLLTVSLLENELMPSILLVDKEKFQELADGNERLLKYDIHGTSYVGRILACSSSRKQLEKTLDQVMVKEKELFSTENGGKQKIMYSCTSLVDIEKAQENEILVIALRVLLKDRFTESRTCEKEPNENINKVAEREASQEPQEHEDIPMIAEDLLMPYDESLSNDAADLIRCSTPSSIHSQLQEEGNNSSQVGMRKGSIMSVEHEQNAGPNQQFSPPTLEPSTSSHNYNASTNYDKFNASPRNQESAFREKTRKRRSKVKKFFADDKLLAKVKTDAFEKKAALDKSIKESLDFLNQTIKTLKTNKPYQPILAHVFKLLQDLNSKMEENDKIKATSSGYMIDKKIEVKKTRDGNIKIGGRLVLPFKVYGYIISRTEPNLIVSRTIRRLYDKNTRLGAELNDKADMSNFIYRIGDSSLYGEERLVDGQKLIDMIIEHAHQVLGLDYICFKEYRECMTQVGKAVYDANRPEGSKKRKSCLFDDSEISNAQSSKRNRKIDIDTESEFDEQALSDDESRS